MPKLLDKLRRKRAAEKLPPPPEKLTKPSSDKAEIEEPVAAPVENETPESPKAVVEQTIEAVLEPQINPPNAMEDFEVVEEEEVVESMSQPNGNGKQQKRSKFKPKFVQKLQDKYAARKAAKQEKRKEKAAEKRKSQPAFVQKMHEAIEEKRRRKQSHTQSTAESDYDYDDEPTDLDMALEGLGDEELRHKLPVIGTVKVTLLSVQNLTKHHRPFQISSVVSLPPNKIQSLKFSGNSIDKSFEFSLYDISSELRILLHDQPKITQKVRPQLGQIVLPLSMLLSGESLVVPVKLRQTLDVKLLPLKERYIKGPQYDGLFTPIYPDTSDTGIKTSHENLGTMRLVVEIHTAKPLYELYRFPYTQTHTCNYKFDVGLLKSAIHRIQLKLSTPALILFVHSNLPLEIRLLTFPLCEYLLYCVCFTQGMYLLPAILFSLTIFNGYLGKYLEDLRQDELGLYLVDNDAKKESALQKLRSLPSSLRSLLNGLMKLASFLEKMEQAFNFSDQSITLFMYVLGFVLTCISTLVLYSIQLSYFGFLLGTGIIFLTLGLQELIPKKEGEGSDIKHPNEKTDLFGLPNILKRIRDRRLADHEWITLQMVVQNLSG